jgi:hypothetical protein
MLSPTDVPAYCACLLCQLTVPAPKGRNSLRAALESPKILAGTNAAGQSPALQVAGLTALARTQILALSVGIADDPRGYERG